MNELPSKVYLLEDSPVDLVINRNLLKILPLTLEVESFSSGREFTDCIQSTSFNKHQKYIALLDIQLPMMSGFDCVDFLRENCPEKLAQLHVFMLSSTIDRKDVEHATIDPDIIQIASDATLDV